MFNNTHKHTTKNKTKSNTGRIPVLYPSPEGATYLTQGASLCMARLGACASQYMARLGACASLCMRVPVHGASLCMAHSSAGRTSVQDAPQCMAHSSAGRTSVQDAPQCMAHPCAIPRINTCLKTRISTL
jgi:hypothetical protein